MNFFYRKAKQVQDSIVAMSNKNLVTASGVNNFFIAFNNIVFEWEEASKYLRS